MADFVKEFASRTPSIGKFYPLRKDSLVLTDPGSYRTGVDEKEMCATFIISAANEDRVGDIVLPSGCNLDNFRRNPIGFFSHQEWPLPIGKWEDREGNLTIFPKDKYIEGTLYFSQRSKEAYQVFSLVAEGILRATSIGFAPLSEPQRRRDIDGYLYDNWELLEASVVGIPCNPLATLIREKLSSGKIAGQRISPHLRKSLEPLAAQQKVTLAFSEVGTWQPGGFKELQTVVSVGTIGGQQLWPKPIDTMIGATMAKQMNESSGAMGGYLEEAIEDEEQEVVKAPMDEGEDEGAEPPEGEEGPVEEKDIQECVSRKIPKLIDEGYEREQAVAIAFSECGEKKYAVLSSMKMQDDEMIILAEVPKPMVGIH